MNAFLSHFADAALAWLETHWQAVGIVYFVGVIVLVSWVFRDNADMDNFDDEI